MWNPAKCSSMIPLFLELLPWGQVEEVLDPSLRGKPIGIKQKYLLVTCNYVARSLGVRKMESLAEVSIVEI